MLFCSLLVSVVGWAEGEVFTEIHINDGPVVIDGEGKTYQQNGATTSFSNTIKITGSLEELYSLITISGGFTESPVEIVLDNVSAKVKQENTNEKYNGICITDNSVVKIYLIGENIIAGGRDGAGIRVPSTATLSIQEYAPETHATLSTYGGIKTDPTSWGGGAGIGGNVGEVCGNVTINSGTIYAEGSKGGAGIGSGWNVKSDVQPGVIRINGGEITAIGSKGLDSGGFLSCEAGIGNISNLTTELECAGGIIRSTVLEGSNITDGNRHALLYREYDGLTPAQNISAKQYDGQTISLTVDNGGKIGFISTPNASTDDIFSGKKLIQAYVSNAENASISGGGVYAENEEVTLTVTINNSNYELQNWEDDAECNSLIRTITASQDAKFTANIVSNLISENCGGISVIINKKETPQPTYSWDEATSTITFTSGGTFHLSGYSHTTTLKVADDTEDVILCFDGIENLFHSDSPLFNIGANSSVVVSLSNGTHNRLWNFGNTPIIIGDNASLTIMGEGYLTTQGGGFSFGNSSQLTINDGTLNIEGRLLPTGTSTNSSVTINGGTISSNDISVQDGVATFSNSQIITNNLNLWNLTTKINDNVTIAIPEGIIFDAHHVTLGENASIDGEFRGKAPSCVNEVYWLYSAEQLSWFRDLVNGTLTDGTVRNKSASAILKEDIDLQNQAWTPMGKYSPWHDGPNNVYSGVFDGNYHTISNLNVSGVYEHGLFGRVNGGQVKNLGIINANIGSAEGYLGVIAGAYVYASGPMLNCYTVGDITFGTTGLAIGGIAGVTEWAGIHNCHTSYGNVIGQTNASSGPMGCSAGLAPNSYETGELAYMLNTANDYAGETPIEGKTEWGQKLDQDEHPVALTAENQVYRQSFTADASTLTINGNYNRVTTLCYPSDITLPASIKAFSVTGINDRYVVMTELTGGILPKHTPAVLINMTAADETIALPAVTGIYSNSAESSITTNDISQEGNLLHGSYESKTLNGSTELKWYYSEFMKYYTDLSPYSAYLKLEEPKDYLSLSTEVPIGEMDYAVLSESDKTAFISRIAYAGIGSNNHTITIPSEVDINGNTYTVTRFGSGDVIDQNCFFNMTGGNHSIALYVNLPKTITEASAIALNNMVGMTSSGIVIPHFSTEDVPTLVGGNDLYLSCNISVPYGAEDAYKSWGQNVFVTSYHSDVDIANGNIIVNGDTYTQGDVVGTINETLLISGSTTENKVILNGGSKESPLRVAVNSLNIDLSAGSEIRQAYCPIDVTADSHVDLLVFGDNTLKGGFDSAGLHVAAAKIDGSQESASLNVCKLSTGTLSAFGGNTSAGLGAGAGIGGNEGENFGEITINAGTITATGIKGAAGIGGGSYFGNTSAYKAGDVTINGGNVTAVYSGDRSGAGSCSVMASVGSIDQEFRFFVSGNATFTGTINRNCDVDMAVKVYSGGQDYSVENISWGTTLADNQLAFGMVNIPGVNNLVVGDVCDNFILHDDLDFYSPQGFTAGNMTYKREFIDNDFNALYLPIEAKVSDFTDCEIYAINMFHQTDTDGDGVLDCFTMEVEKAQNNQTLRANHPYLIKYKGTEYNTRIEFHLEQMTVSETSSPDYVCSSMNYTYTFRGNYQSVSDNLSQIYVIGIDSEGRTALVHPTSDLGPQRWQMVMTPREPQFGEVMAATPARIHISVAGDETGIIDIPEQADKAEYYDLDGRRKQRLSRGITILRHANGSTEKIIKE